MRKQIKQYIDNVLDVYYLEENGKLYNAETRSYVKCIGGCSYMLKTDDKKSIKRSLKKLYKLCYGKEYSVNNIVSLNNERWLEVPDTEGCYLVSNMGRIISLKEYEARLLMPNVTKCGYERVQLTINGKKKDMFVHRIVAYTWLQTPLQDSIEQYQIHHINNNKRDNRADNLCYLKPDKHRQLHIEQEKEKKNVDRAKSDTTN